MRRSPAIPSPVRTFRTCRLPLPTLMPVRRARSVASYLEARPVITQNGKGCDPLCTVTQRRSVNSSRTALPPKRPKPLSLTPPNGI